MTNLFVVPIKHFLHARHRNCTSETRNRTPENELLYSSPSKKKKKTEDFHTQRESAEQRQREHETKRRRCGELARASHDARREESAKERN